MKFDLQDFAVQVNSVYAAYALFAGLALLALAFLWLVIQAFRTGVWWGLGVLVFPPLALVFVPVHWKPARGPVALAMFACVVSAGAMVAGQFNVSRAARIKDVEGEKHITLTRAKGDYVKVLKENPKVEVLQMADCDVGEELLEVIATLTELRELDLNQNPITDDGLVHLARLTNLKILRLNETQITNDGFEKHIAPLPKLAEVNLRQTKVSRATAVAWVKKGKELGIERKQTSGK